MPLFNLGWCHRLHHETSRDCILRLLLVILLTLLPVAGRSGIDTTGTGGRDLLEIALPTALIGHHTIAIAIGAARLQKPERIRRHSLQVGTYSRISCAENLLVAPRR